MLDTSKTLVYLRGESAGSVSILLGESPKYDWKAVLGYAEIFNCLDAYQTVDHLITKMKAQHLTKHEELLLSLVKEAKVKGFTSVRFEAAQPGHLTLLLRWLATKEQLMLALKVTGVAANLNTIDSFTSHVDWCNGKALLIECWYASGGRRPYYYYNINDHACLDGPEELVMKIVLAAVKDEVLLLQGNKATAIQELMTPRTI